MYSGWNPLTDEKKEFSWVHRGYIAAMLDPATIDTRSSGAETELIVASKPLDRLTAEAQAFIHAAKAPSTLRAYAADWRHFTSWCEGHRLSALPATPETIAFSPRI